MEASQIIIQLLNGISYSLLLFLLAAGLSLIFGLMGIINMAHGSYYMLGAYIGISVIRLTGSFLLAILMAVAAVSILGIIMERVFLGRLYRRGLDQVLLTFGFSYIFMDIAKSIWGKSPLSASKPNLLEGSLVIMNEAFPIYRIAIIVIGITIALGLWLFLERTRTGVIIRAGVDDREMVSGMGINIRMYFMLVFALGACIAAFGGVIGAPVIGAYPGSDTDVLILALAVVVVGGLGTLKGAFWGSLLVGFTETLGKTILPDYAIFATYVIMVLILIFKPAGLLGRSEL
jgi:branched-subunit amino acid ABC-type transport system permease component